MSTFALHIVSPVRDIFSGTVDYVSLNTPDGRAGFLRGALSRVAVLSEGVIEIAVGEEKLSFYCGDGIYSVNDGGMTIAVCECYDLDKPENDGPINEVSARQYKYAKARIASSLIKMKGSKYPEESF